MELLVKSVVEGNVQQVVESTKAHLSSGMDPLDIIAHGLVAGMNIVGPRFKSGEMYVPEVIMSAKAMSGGMELLKTYLKDDNLPSEGKIVIGTVKGDLHDIGKNLVAILLESSGYKIIDLGVDISPEEFSEAAHEHQPDVIGLSALLTTTMIEMKNTVDYLSEKGLRNNVKIITGGAPVTAAFSKEIGADGYAPDAGSAVELVQSLLNND